MELASLVDQRKPLKLQFDYSRDLDAKILLQKIKDLQNGHEKIPSMLSDYVTSYHEFNATSMKMAMELLDSVWFNICRDFLAEIQGITGVSLDDETIHFHLTMWHLQPTGEETSIVVMNYATPTDRILQQAAIACIAKAVDKKLTTQDSEKRRLILKITSLLIAKAPGIQKLVGEIRLSKEESEVLEQFRPLFVIGKLDEFLQQLQK